MQCAFSAYQILFPPPPKIPSNLAWVNLASSLEKPSNRRIRTALEHGAAITPTDGKSLYVSMYLVMNVMAAQRTHNVQQSNETMLWRDFS